MELPTELRLEQPAWLWICVALVPMLVLALRWFTTMSSARVVSAIGLRIALIVLLALALAQLGRIQRTNSLAVVTAIDTSDSVRRFASRSGALSLEQIQASINTLDQARSGEDLLGLVAFDDHPRTIASPRIAHVADRALEGGTGSGSNLEKAIDHALSILPPQSAGRILLISDGNQTSGDAVEAARRAKSIARRGVGGKRGVSIDVLPVDYDIRNEVLIESVDAPPQAAQSSSINLRVTLYSTIPVVGRIAVLDEGIPVDLNGAQDGAARAVNLQAGTTVVVLPVQLDARRVHRFEVVFEPEGAGKDGEPLDTFADNNRASAFTLTPGRGAVLIVDGVSNGEIAGPGGVLAATLLQAGIDVTTVAPESIPTDLLDLQRFDLIVLQNVPADAVASNVQQLLVSHVQDFGAGLVMIGGPDSFASGGWKGSVIEPILPVNLEIPDKVLTPDAAIMLVLDNSGSMAFFVMGSSRSKMEIANEAAAAAVGMLDKRDMLGVIAFNSDYEVLVPLAPNKDAAKTQKIIRNIGADGGTNLGPALEAATRQLQSVNAKVKHIIVLSDGRSQNHEYLPGIAQRALAQGIKVSTISVGDDADPVTMGKIAAEGGGRHHEVINPNVLPKVFLRAIRVVRAPFIKEQPFLPVISNPASPLVSGLSNLPRLGGLAMTDQRKEPTIFQAILTPANEPVLAHWNVGLGQVVAFTSDAHRWAKEWIDSPVYREFWTRLCRTTARSQNRDASQARVEVVDGQLKVNLNAVSETGATIDALTVNATIYTPSGQTREIQLLQSGPGEYSGGIPVESSGSYVVVVRPDKASTRIAPLVAGVSTNAGEEFRKLKSDRALLEAIARESSGRVLAMSDLSPRLLFDRAGVVPQETWLALTRAILVAALVALMLDLATRRIAWDRFFSPEFGADLARTAADTQSARSAQAASTLSKLRDRETQRPEVSEVALSQADGLKLAKEQADKRRAARLSQWKESSAPPSTGATTPHVETSPEDGPAETGLLAAKRRANKKFEE